ncbi:hypothetical protein PMAYCL1PPCAC_11333 [Pristionchus mayeri]|uniref:Uncharacterized protein n=1 Tax=Pristionchus mayeri TaxID=1317129 RepID=A0AAN4ZH45_9BILA|nr:hypothetical protein PMAYCL1PPCAC_11333 [Pristionchus mayeri]
MGVRYIIDRSNHWKRRLGLNRGFFMLRNRCARAIPASSVKLKRNPIQPMRERLPPTLSIIVFRQGGQPEE